MVTFLSLIYKKLHVILRLLYLSVIRSVNFIFLEFVRFLFVVFPSPKIEAIHFDVVNILMAFGVLESQFIMSIPIIQQTIPR